MRRRKGGQGRWIRGFEPLTARFASSRLAFVFLGYARDTAQLCTMATAQATKNKITLKGSTGIVTEFFGYAVNSILYQRGIYSPESFEAKQKYGLRMLVTTDESLKARLMRRPPCQCTRSSRVVCP